MSRESEDGGALTDPATEPCNLEGVEGSPGSSLFLRRGKRRAEAPKDVFCILVLLQKCSIWNGWGSAESDRCENS